MKTRLALAVAPAALLLAALACRPSTPAPTSPTAPVLSTDATATSPALEPTAETPRPQPTEEAVEATAAPQPSPQATPDVALRIAYSRDGNLWLAEGDAVPRQLTTGGQDGSPLFSMDGREVLFRRQLPPGAAGLPRQEIRVIGVDGTGERLLVGADDLPGELGMPMGSDSEVMLDRVPHQVAWLPDGRVAFNTTIETGYGVTTNDDLWLVDTQGGEPAQLLPDGQGGAFAFSPDGSWLVVSTPSTVALMNASGGERRTLLTFEPVATASEYAYYPFPVWAPDGSHALIAISSPEPFWPDAEGGITGTLYRLTPDGGAEQQATLEGRFLFNTMADLLWSADRSHIAYTAPIGDLTENQVELRVASGEGMDPVAYATGRLEFHAWAPDSLRFAYQDHETGEWFLGEPGAPAQPLLPPEADEQVIGVTWARGEAMVLVTNEEGIFRIWLVPPDGMARLVDTAGTLPGLDAYP